MVDVITYETLYDLLREEKAASTLVKLDPDFFEKVSKYIAEKQAILLAQEQKSSVFTASETLKTKKQLDNIQRIIRELYERREFKIIDLATFQSRTNELVDLSTMLEIEKQLYFSVLESLNLFRKEILFALLEARIPKKVTEIAHNSSTQEKPKELKTVRFVQAVPKFVGADLKVYGPFEEEDVASVPSRIAEILVKKEKVKVI